MFNFLFKVKSPGFEKVSQRVVQDTVNLLFNMSSTPLSHDIYQRLEVMMEKLVIKVSEMKSISLKISGMYTLMPKQSF